MDEITKINHETGDIIWRMGGENNQFTFVNDTLTPPFSHQHDVRRIENGNITLFDNGNLHIPPVTYAKEYLLDEENKTATLVWSYKHPPVNGIDVISLAAGDVQRLPNGNTLIDYGVISNWDLLPNATEVTPAGDIAWEIKFSDLEDELYSYCMHKYLWSPCSRPTDYTLNAQSISPTTEKLSWATATGAHLYRAEYRVTGSNTWKVNRAVSTNIHISNLQPNTAYEWHVKTICARGASSGYTAVHTFQTPAMKLPNEHEVSSVSLFPNPAGDIVSILMEADEAQPITVTIMDVEGNTKLVHSYKLVQGKNEIQLDIRSLPKGAYSILVQMNQTTAVEKLMVE